jgi:hypothetical protein
MKRKMSDIAWILLAAILLLFVLDDIAVWVERGTIPGGEFLAVGLLVVVALYFGIRDMQQHRPPGR